uniref:Uncharacterized protein n=1 Tax=Caenorhabditis japonica TaxID=281687 RepID=A0A8R1IBU1_CAEJA
MIGGLQRAAMQLRSTEVSDSACINNETSTSGTAAEEYAYSWQNEHGPLSVATRKSETPPPEPNIDSDGSQFNFDTAIEDKAMGKSLDAMEVDEQESDGDDKKESGSDKERRSDAKMFDVNEK